MNDVTTDSKSFAIPGLLHHYRGRHLGPGKLTQAADLVKQMTSIEDFSGATDTALEIRFNELLAALRVASILSK